MHLISNVIGFDMLAVYFELMKNARIAARIYAQRYPDRRHYNYRVFTGLAARLRGTGSIRGNIHRRRRRGRIETNVINVLAYIQINPHVSIRTISGELGISHGTVENILKEHRYLFLFVTTLIGFLIFYIYYFLLRLHPYHVVLHQALLERDFDNRLDFCYWMLNMVREEPRFISKILWTDEASFSSDGGVNLHNMQRVIKTQSRCLKKGFLLDC